jgi:quercetin dioxygenase-like cupin family protein
MSRTGLCAAGLIGFAVGAFGMHALHAQAPAIKRVPLMKADLTGTEGKEVVMTLIEAQPGADFPAHTHPGDEFLFVIEGSIATFVEQHRTSVPTGGTFHAPREKAHGGSIGDKPARLLTVHIVDKGKPFAEPVKN